MRNLKLALALAGALALSVVSAIAQVSAPNVTVSWLPLGKIAAGMSVTTSPGAATALPAGGDTVFVFNTGSTDAFVAVGASSVAASSTLGGSTLVKAGTCANINRRSNSNVIQGFISAVTASSTTTLSVETGIGSTSCSGGGGGGGGGGGAVTVADGADVTQGAIADAAATAGGAGTISAKLRTLTAQLPAALITAGADGVSNTLSGMQTYARTQCYNGSTWDRCTQIGTGTPGTPNVTTVLSVQGEASMTPLFMQSATLPVSTMNNASGTGAVTAANAYVFDDVSPTAITENNFGFARMSANRNVYQTIRDAAGNERGANVAAPSTAPVAADPALVVAISPNGINANGQATMANSAPVVIASDQTPIQARPSISTISTTITRPADTNVYAVGDAFSNSTSAPTTGGFTLTNACRASGGYGNISDLVISSSAGTLYQGQLWVYDQAVTNINDNAAFSVSDAEQLNFVGLLTFVTSEGATLNAVGATSNLNVGYTCVGSTNLRFIIKLTAAATPASAEVLSVRVKVQN